MFSTPILFLVFNRPSHTRKVFSRIREIRPSRIFIAADGPRKGNESDGINCKETRESILSMIDWDCEVKTLFREDNLGCGAAISGALDWFFDQVDQGIVLEDDCLPEYSFFSYCEKLLDRYKNDSNVMHIGGNNFQNGKRWGTGSYYFSGYGHIWGWATWKRAWKTYNYDIASFEDKQIAQHLREEYKFSKKATDFWTRKLNEFTLNKIDTWDFQWQYSIWKEKGICVIPNVNLVRNIGFDETATHTKGASPDLTLLMSSDIDEISFSDKKEIIRQADEFTFNKYYDPNSVGSSLNKLKALVLKITGA